MADDTVNVPSYPVYKPSAAGSTGASSGGIYGSAFQIGFDAGTVIGNKLFNKKPKSKPATYFQLPTSYPNDALQNYLSRIYAANVGDVPPSFADYVGSGGTATFPFKDPGMTPNEAAELGFVSPQGGTMPFYRPGQTQLDPTQQLSEAQSLFQQHRLRDFPYLHQLFTAHQDLQKRAQGLETKIKRHPNQATANADRQKRHDALLAQYFQQTGGRSIA